ncbi:MAG: DUF5106 domain-containing protein [Bacteroidales bacterium]|nr:DUF5106 domain-containing protein [Bacteroidales bacterium]MBQ8839635.1 DUF5106 domain-containing protein [Bacteroidales bacterium]
MKYLNIFIYAAALFAAAACGPKKNTAFNPVPFPEMAPPGMMTEPQDRADWLAMHYWDGITETSRTYPCDSLMVSGVRKGDVEQRFANWLSVLENVFPQTAEQSVLRLCERALACEETDTASNVLETVTELIEKYLYDPNSPFRNEDIYGRYVGRLAQWEGLSPEIRGKYEREAALCSLNGVGTVATDFRFADRMGRIHTLHGIRSPLTLLFFSNPGCEACMNIINVLKGEPRISGLIASKKLAVLNIYIDEDIAAWRSYMRIYPEEWYNGFDPDFAIRTETLYDVRAIPSLYLLDEDKTVIMKDAPENRVFEYLAGI